MSSRCGDSHRFGQRVKSAVETDGETNWYLKPRPGFFEKTLFDKRGALFGFVSNVLGYEPPLEISIESPWSSRSKSLTSLTYDVTSAERNTSKVFARRAGRLLALATYLGLADLHSENILIVRLSDGGLAPVPIDIEMAFWKCVSVMDTLLLPSTLVKPELAGFSGQFCEAYSPRYPDVVLDEFLESSFQLLPQLRKVLDSFVDLAVDVPNRVLLRPTREYRDIFESQNIESKFTPEMLPEEQMQLLSGDIPYFFVLRKRQGELFYFSEPDIVSECDPKHFRPVVDCASPQVSELCNEQRCINVMKISALQICRAFDAQWPRSPVVGQHFKLEASASQFLLSTDHFKVACKR